MDCTLALVRDRLAVFMVLSAAVMWGTTGTARALAPGTASPLSVGAVRIAIGGTALLLVALVRGSLVRERWPALTTLVAAAGVAAYQLSFFEGVARAGVAVGTIVAIGSAPLFTGVLALLSLGERPSRRWLLATALGVAGVALLSLPRAGADVAPLALVLPLTAGASYAVYATAAKALLTRHDDVAVAAAAFAGGAILLAPLLVLTDLSWLRVPSGVAVALELGLVTVTAAYVLFMRGLARIPVSWGATLSLAEPLTAATLGTLVLGESLAAAQLAGAALVAAGLAVLSTATS